MPRIARLARLLTRSSLVLLGAALLIPAAVPFTASAQNVRFATTSIGGGADFTPAISRSHFNRYAKVLGLEGDLKLIASSVLDSYLDEFRAEAGVVRKKMDDLREEAAATQDFSVFGREMPAIMEAWTKKSEALEQKLFNDLQALLTEDQLAKWPVVERERRRHELLPTGRLSGESIDMIELVERLRTERKRGEEPITLPEEIDQLLEQYAVEMDSALQTRQRLIEPLQQSFFQTMVNNRAEGEKIWKEATEKRRVVRDVNRRYLATLKATLGEERGVRLEELFMEQAYPAAYAPTKAEKFINLALALDSLTSEQAGALTGFQQSLDARLEPIRRSIVKYTDEEDEKLPPWLENVQVSGDGSRGVALTFAGNMGGDEDNPLQKALRDRFRSSKEILDQAENVLTESQREAMPEIDAENDMMRTLRIGPSML